MQPKIKTSSSIKTLAGFMVEAGLTAIPRWADSVGLWLPPLQHQIVDVNHLALHTRYGIWSEMGTGKTYSLQTYLLWLVGLGNKAVAIMPPSLIKQFWQAFDDPLRRKGFEGVREHVKIALFYGDVEKRNALLAQWESEGWPDIVITTFGLFCGKSNVQLDRLEQDRALKNKAVLRTQADLANPQFWLNKGYTALAVDEAHFARVHTSALNKAIKTFAGPNTSLSNGVVLVTGTPIENNLTDAYGLISILDPNRYKSYRSFERMHVIKTPGPYSKIIGYDNEEYLNQGLYALGRRVLKKDIMDMPPKVISEIDVELSPEHHGLYSKIVKERLLEIGDKIIDATTEASLRQKVQQILLTPNFFTEKPVKDNELLNSLQNLLKELGKEKLLLYAYYTRSIKYLQDVFKDLNPAVIYGEVTGLERERQKHKFIEEDSCRLCIAQPRSGGVGIDGFQTVCSHVAFVEIIPIPGVFQQAVDRLHRAGQTKYVNVYVFVPRRTIAVKLRNELVKKDLAANSVVRDRKAVLADLMGECGLQGTL